METKTPTTDSREALLVAAKSVFSKHGYEGATVKELADTAQVNVSLVSYYFGGKEGLFRTMIEDFGKSRLAIAERTLKPAKNREEFKVRISLFMEEFFEKYFLEPEVTHLIHRECDSGNPLIEDIFKNVFLKIFHTFHNYLNEAQNLGLIANEVDTQVAASVLFGSMMHSATKDQMSLKHFGVTLRDPATLNRIIEQTLNTFLFGVLPRDGSSQNSAPHSSGSQSSTRPST